MRISSMLSIRNLSLVPGLLSSPSHSCAYDKSPGTALSSTPLQGDAPLIMERRDNKARPGAQPFIFRGKVYSEGIGSRHVGMTASLLAPTPVHDLCSLLPRHGKEIHLFYPTRQEQIQARGLKCTRLGLDACSIFRQPQPPFAQMNSNGCNNKFMASSNMIRGFDRMEVNAILQYTLPACE